ncbi:MAG: hypothetical protein SCK57_13575 [Bacillota bacterium]|nr:hypothetical protein [Bacillota bacterium]
MRKTNHLRRAGGAAAGLAAAGCHFRTLCDDRHQLDEQVHDLDDGGGIGLCQHIFSKNQRNCLAVAAPGT